MKILEYTGEIVPKKEGNKRAEEQYKRGKNNKSGFVYVFILNNEYDLDGDVSYNTARFINHSCNPNCRYEIKRKHIWIIAIKDIKKGEELTYDYGYDIDGYKEHTCNCKSPNCIGYIVSNKAKEKLKRILER